MTSKMLKTLFLQAPSFDGFDGGAGSRYQAKREIRSFWYPTWLAQPAEDIDDYAARHRLPFVHDPSNADARFARSRLRHAVMPGLRAAFPQAEAALSGVAA